MSAELGHKLVAVLLLAGKIIFKPLWQSSCVRAPFEVISPSTLLRTVSGRSPHAAADAGGVSNFSPALKGGNDTLPRRQRSTPDTRKSIQCYEPTIILKLWKIASSQLSLCTYRPPTCIALYHTRSNKEFTDWPCMRT